MVKIETLSTEGFNRFGSIFNLLEDCNEPLSDNKFCPDRIRQSLGKDTIVSYSVCHCVETALKIDRAEYHNFTDELIMPVDGDCLFYVAPPTLDGSFPFKEVRVFLIPQSTMIILKPGVWHYAPIPYRSKRVAVLCGLPQLTYRNDCKLIELPEEQQITIIDDRGE